MLPRAPHHPTLRRRLLTGVSALFAFVILAALGESARASPSLQGPTPSSSRNADLHLSAKRPTSTVLIGEETTITFTIENRGPFAARRTVFKTSLPGGTAFVLLQAPRDNCRTPSVGETGSIRCPLGRINAGQQVQVHVVLRISASSDDELEFGAVLGAPNDFNLENNRAETIIQLTAPAPIPTEDTRPAFEPASPSAPTADLVVNSYADDPDAGIDGDCNTSAGACTLRAAIQEANADADTDTIKFTAMGAGTINVGSSVEAPNQLLPSITQPIIIDGYTASGGTPAARNTDPDGVNTALNVRIHNATTVAIPIGLYLAAGSDGSRISGLSITNFLTVGGGAAIQIDSDGNIIDGNFIGLAQNGDTSGANYNGIVVNGDNNIIGGANATNGNRNLIAYSGTRGILITGDGNSVEDNFIGFEKTLTAGGNSVGIVIDGTAATPSGNVIGGDVPAATAGGKGNVISYSSGNGINIIGEGATGNSVEGNCIGTDPSCSADAGNGNDGVLVSDGAADNVIGGSSANQGNVISANAEYGIHITDSATQGTIVSGNRIGTTADGENALPNGSDGVSIESADDSVIGGLTHTAGVCDLACNLISGNDERGIRIESGAGGTIIQGNFIGPDIDGDTVIGNDLGGILISLASNNTVGGNSPEARNVISGNDGEGILIEGETSNLNTIVGNYIGVTADGTDDIGNSAEGVSIDGAPNNTIGGAASGERNIISGNDSHGVLLSSGLADGNQVQGNYIGIDVNGGPEGNLESGVYIAGGYNNLIGGTGAGEGNVIATNGLDDADAGVWVDTGDGNAILGNSIYGNFGPGIQLTGGGNNSQVSQSISLAASGSTKIEGEMTGVIGRTYRLEFFSNSACDTSGFGEGETFLGNLDLLLSASPMPFSVTLAPSATVGDDISGTATDLTTSDTSAFSACEAVVAYTATPTSTATKTQTPTSTRTPSRTPTKSPLPSATSTQAPSGDGDGGGVSLPPSFTPTPTSTQIGTNTPTPTIAGAFTSTPTPTVTALPTASPTLTPPASATPTEIPTITPAVLVTDTPTSEASATPTTEPTLVAGAVTGTPPGGASPAPGEGSPVPTGALTGTPQPGVGPMPTPTPTGQAGGARLGVAGAFPLITIGGLADYNLPWFVENISTPSEAFSGGLARILPNLLLALILALLFGFFGTLQSNTLEEHEEEIRGWLDPVIRPIAAIAALGAVLDANLSRRGVGWLWEGLKVILVLFIFGVIFSFLDPSFDLGNPGWLLLVLAVMMSVGLVSLIDDAAKVIYSRRMGGAGSIGVNGANLGVALGSMVFSRLAGLAPGIVFGSAGSAQGELKGQPHTLSFIGIAAIGVTALIGWGISNFIPQVPGGDMWLATLFLLIFAVGIQTLFFELIPAYGTMGRDLFRETKLLWGVIFAAVLFLFIQTQLNPDGDFVGAFNQPNMVALAIVVVIFCAISGGLWLYFWYRDRQRA